jgi:AraC-like DNA-binding protein
MIYELKSPSPALEPYVDCFWLLSAPKGDVDAEPEIVLPDGKTELIVHFGDDFFKHDSTSNQFVRQARVLMSGQLTERILLKPSGEIGVVSVRFKSAGAARFFNIGYDSYVNQVFDFYTVESDVANVIHAKVSAATSVDSRIKVLEDMLTERLSVDSGEDVFVRQACNYLVQSEGQYTITDLAKLIGFSERQLERKFKHQVGLSPKRLARILRFQKFLQIAQTTKTLTLTDAALACGYYDQSHFIKDFTAFSGVSPLNYLTAPHAMSDYFTTPSPLKG